MGGILGAMAAFLVAALVFIDRSHNMAAPSVPTPAADLTRAVFGFFGFELRTGVEIPLICRTQASQFSATSSVRIDELDTPDR
jgi:hypothetical protein